MTMQNIINFFWNKNAEFFDEPKYLLLERRTYMGHSYNDATKTARRFYGKASISLASFCHELYDQANNAIWFVDWRVDEKALLREVTPHINVILSHWLIKDGKHCYTPAAFCAQQKITHIVERHSEAAARLGILQRPCYFIRDAFYSMKYRQC